MFCKQEKKKKHPILTLTVTLLSTVGTISILTVGRQCMDSCAQRVTAMFRLPKKCPAAQQQPAAGTDMQNAAGQTTA